MGMREATPGAMKLPQGVRDKERIQLLEDRLAVLERAALTPGAAVAPGSDRDALIAKAVELGVGAPSQLARWGEARLKEAIAAKAEG